MSIFENVKGGNTPINYYSKISEILHDSYMDKIKNIFGIPTDGTKMGTPPNKLKGKIKYILKIKYGMMVKVPVENISERIIRDNLSTNEELSLIFMSSYLDEVLSMNGIDFIIDFYNSDLLRIYEDGTVSIDKNIDFLPRYSMKDMHKIINSIYNRNNSASLYDIDIYDNGALAANWVYYYLVFATIIGQKQKITELDVNIRYLHCVMYALEVLGYTCTMKEQNGYIDFDVKLKIDKDKSKGVDTL